MSSDFIAPNFHGTKFTAKFFTWTRIESRKQVNERQDAVGIPDEMIEDEIAPVTGPKIGEVHQTRVLF